MNGGSPARSIAPTPAPREAGWPRRVATVLLAAVIGLALAGLLAYLLYVGAAGSERFIHPTDKNEDCRTPAVRHGWDYEAINYDKADDARLAATFGDMKTCASQGDLAGAEVTAADGIHIGGWYIPAANGVGPSGPTVILVHGGAANKSEVLKYAPPFHERYNIVAFDLRNGGRSSPADTTLGYREQLDVGAVIDWLDRTKHPRWIGVMGNSMGAASALAAARGDERIRALLLDSMHARAVTMVGRIFEAEVHHPPQPGGWAIVIGVSLRIGEDVTGVDPVRTITALGDRPVLLIHGTADEVNRPGESAELNLAAARDAGVPAELEYCEGGTHGELIDRCPEEWARWATRFFEGAAAH
jgi:uncharacterized protein